MPFLFLYLIKFSISLAVLYIFYYLVLRPLTFYQWNRFYLVCYSLLSFIIPFINITGWLSGKDINDSYLLNSIPAVDKLTSTSFHTPLGGTNIFSIVFSWNFVGLLFLAGAAVMITRIIYQYLSLHAMKRKAVLLKTGEFEFYDVNSPITPFSFANAIYINSRLHSEEEFHKILEHEFVHVKQKHTIDIVVAELVCVFNWFNPFAWLIRKTIRQNLEFIADHNVLETGMDARQYQYLLLKVMGLPQYSITNNFSFSSLKKRIAMMNKIKTARVHLVKFLFVLPLLAIMLLAFRDKINFNKNASTLTDAVIIENAGDNQPLKNITVKATKEGDHLDDAGALKKSRKNTDVDDVTTYPGISSDTMPRPVEKPIPSLKVTSAEVVVTNSPVVNPEVKVIRLNKVTVDKEIKNSKPVILAVTSNKPVTFVTAVTADIPITVVTQGSSVKRSATVKPLTANMPVTTVVPVTGYHAATAADTGSPKIFFRSINTKGNDPLYIVDGKEITNEELGKIEPNSISAINVLKGVSAEALYGERAKDGVIMITMKGKQANTDVNINSKSGVRLGGLNDFTGLIIVDGKESSLSVMNQINPDTIESVSVLKDKESTAIYNEKGKNGVIIITTKKKI